MRNSTDPEASFVHWAAREAEHSPRFRSEIDRLRQLAGGQARGGYRRSTGQLSKRPWAQLEQTLADSLRLSQPQRPRAWANTLLPTDEGLRHLRDYLRGCRKLARTFLGHEQAAPLIHGLVTRTGYRIEVGPMAAPPAPTQKTASALAAYITGASWGAGATALRQAWYRARPRAPLLASLDSPAFLFLRSEEII